MTTRAVELGLIPIPRRRIVAGTASMLLAGCLVAQIWSSTARQIVGGLVVGMVSLGLQFFALMRLPRATPRAMTASVVAVSVVGAALAFVAAGAWVLRPGTIAATALASVGLVVLLWTRIRNGIERRQIDAFDLANATPDQVDRFIARASRFSPGATFACVEILYRGRRLTRALELLRAARVDHRNVRADWLIHLHLELGDVALAREVLDLASGTVHKNETFAVLEAQVRIAEGQAAQVLDELIADPPKIAPKAIVWRWATRADAMVTLGDLTRARDTLARIAEHDAACLARLAAGGRPCRELAQQVKAGAGAPFR